MCLDSIKEQNDSPSTMIMCGWKEFDGSGTSLKFQNNPLKGSHDVPLNEWVIACKIKIDARDGKRYESGFHVYTEENELTKSSMSYRRVYIRKIQTLGKQGGMTVAIAEEMYVPSDPNDWPQDDQKEQYLKLGYFETLVNDKTYRINKGRAGNVMLIEKGIIKYKYCAHPNDYSPAQDAMLAQLLMLTTDEDRFLKTANRTVLG